jgi:hypothetical protein
VTGKARWASWLAAAAVAAFALAGPAAARDATKVIVVKPATLVQMTGSDIFCTVLKEGTTSAVACFHDPGGANSSVRKGRAIVATDSIIGVEPPGSNTPDVLKHQPSFGANPVFPGGASSSKVVTLVPNEVIEVGGTRMALLIKKFSDGGNTVIVTDIGKTGLIDGSYTVGLGNKYALIARVAGSKFQSVYQHAAYS